MNDKYKNWNWKLKPWFMNKSLNMISNLDCVLCSKMKLKVKNHKFKGVHLKIHYSTSVQILEFEKKSWLKKSQIG